MFVSKIDLKSQKYDFYYVHACGWGGWGEGALHVSFKNKIRENKWKGYFALFVYNTTYVNVKADNQKGTASFLLLYARDKAFHIKYQLH